MNFVNTKAMRWLAAMLAVAVLTVAPMGALADGGRAAPNCVTIQAANLQPTMDLDPGTCVIVDLGVLNPGDVYAMDIVVVDDAIDLLFFDQNGIQPYELGQSYRSSMVQPASTESALGTYEFHWKVPPSISAKRWFMVLDNQLHDGDAGQGDQGGQRSTVSAMVAPVTQSYWTPFNDLVGVEANTYSVLLSGDDLRLDAGTIVVVSAWELEFSGDVYLQTRAMHDRYTAGSVGIQFISGGELQNVDSSRSLTWQVPASLEGEELLLVVDNTDSPLGGGDGSQDLRLTVRLELAPPLTPVVNDDQGGTVSIGQTIRLDASLTPNRMGQQGTFVWDFDATNDNNGDGNDTNDVDASGVTVSTSWNEPGPKTVHVLMTAPSGDTAMVAHQVMVVDTEPPKARIQTDAIPVAGGWRVDVNNPLTMHCESSTDDDAVSGCSWTIDGTVMGNDTSLQITWEDIGVHVVELTVTDPTGNTDTTTATVRSLDPSVPSVSPVDGTPFPTTATEGDTITFTVVVTDSFDESTALRVHWDLQPTKDTDGNGDPKDDPDRMGLNPKIQFNQAGQQDIVVTVFDASNNSASFAFSLTVAAAPVESTSSMAMVGLVAVLLLLMGVGLLGNRFYQRRLAVDLLLNRGLSGAEAKAHMSMVAQQTRFSLLAKAEAYAGLNQGEVRPQAEQEALQKQAEFDSIYGTTETVDPSLAFAPPAYSSAPMSQASSQAAAEAAALLIEDGGLAMSNPQTSGFDALSMLMDDEEDEPMPAFNAVEPAVALAVEPAPAPVSGVNLPMIEPVSSYLPTAPAAEGGASATVSLPPTPVQSVPTVPAVTPPPAPAPALVRHACNACQAVFELDLPAGLTEALVACPGCGVDQHVRLSL